MTNSSADDEIIMKENEIQTNVALGKINQSDILKCDSVRDAEITSECVWANTFVDQAGWELLGWTNLPEPRMSVLLEWAFRTGHRLGVNVAGKDQIDRSRHNKIYDEAFELFRRDFRRYDPTADKRVGMETEYRVLGQDPIDDEEDLA